MELKKIKLTIENKKAAGFGMERLAKLLLALLVAVAVIIGIVRFGGIDFLKLLPNLSESPVEAADTIGTAEVSEPKMYEVTSANLKNEVEMGDALKSALIDAMNAKAYVIIIQTYLETYAGDRSKPVIYSFYIYGVDELNQPKKWYQSWDYSNQVWTNPPTATEPAIPTKQSVSIKTLNELYQVFPAIKPTT